MFFFVYLLKTYFHYKNIFLIFFYFVYFANYKFKLVV